MNHIITAKNSIRMGQQDKLYQAMDAHQERVSTKRPLCLVS